MNAILMLWAILCLLFGPTGYLDARDSNVVATLLTVIGVLLLVLALQAPPS